jgi:hypothetical protein
VYIDIRGDQVEVCAADDCRSLDIRVPVDERERVDGALRAAQLGHWDGSAEAELSVAALKQAASRGPVGADWTQRWNAMIDYARSKGWLSADEARVQAHLVDSER